MVTHKIFKSGERYHTKYDTVNHGILGRCFTALQLILHAIVGVLCGWSYALIMFAMTTVYSIPAFTMQLECDELKKCDYNKRRYKHAWSIIGLSPILVFILCSIFLKYVSIEVFVLCLDIIMWSLYFTFCTEMSDVLRNDKNSKRYKILRLIIIVLNLALLLVLVDYYLLFAVFMVLPIMELIDTFVLK